MSTASAVGTIDLIKDIITEHFTFAVRRFCQCALRFEACISQQWNCSNQIADKVSREHHYVIFQYKFISNFTIPGSALLLEKAVLQCVFQISGSFIQIALTVCAQVISSSISFLKAVLGLEINIYYVRSKSSTVHICLDS